MQKKNKYLGFRISYTDYMKTIEVAQNAGVSITDFVKSILLPVINGKDFKQPLKDENDTPKIMDNSKPFLKEKQNIIPVGTFSNNDLVALKQKEKIYIQKLKSM